MNKRMGVIAIVGWICLLIGILCTSVMVAAISVEPTMAHAVTREQTAAVTIGLMWLGLGAVLVGMWAGYQMAQRKVPLLSGHYSGWMLAASSVVSLMLYMTLPINWISHYQPNFYWWFVFAHIVALFLFMVFALIAGFVGRALLRTA